MSSCTFLKQKPSSGSAVSKFVVMSIRMKVAVWEIELTAVLISRWDQSPHWLPYKSILTPSEKKFFEIDNESSFTSPYSLSNVPT